MFVYKFDVLEDSIPDRHDRSNGYRLMIDYTIIMVNVLKIKNKSKSILFID